MVGDCFLAKAYLASRDNLNVKKNPQEVYHSTSLLSNSKRFLKDFRPGGTVCVGRGFWFGGCRRGVGSGAGAWAFIGEGGKALRGAAV